MSEEWGPWVEHDGRGCPCKGMFVEAVDRWGHHDRFVAWTVLRGRPYIDEHFNAWVWSGHPDDIIRYRIRKPRAMKRLNEILREVEDRPKVGA